MTTTTAAASLVAPFDADKAMSLTDAAIARYAVTNPSLAQKLRDARPAKVEEARKAHAAEAARVNARAEKARVALAASAGNRTADALLTDAAAIVAMVGVAFIMEGELSPVVYNDRVEGWVAAYGGGEPHRCIVAHPDAAPLAGYVQSAGVEMPYAGAEGIEFSILRPDC